MPTVLVTGANRGIGLEFVRQYAEEGWQVVACCREPGRARDLTALAEASEAVEVLPLDVAEERSIAALPPRLGDRGVDLLINNAGMGAGDRDTFETLDAANWLRVLHVNTVAPILVTRALLPAIERGEMRRVALVSSRLGAIALNESGARYAYRSSKAALNMAGVSLARDLAGRASVVMLHPGWVRTDMGGPNADIGVEESVAGMRRVIAGAGPGESGAFFNYDGTPLPW